MANLYIPSLYIPNQKPLLGQLPDLSHPASDGLVGEWVMNEGGGSTVQDYSGNGNDGTITGATWGAGGLLFTADNQYVHVPDIVSVTATVPWTVIVRFRLTAQIATGGILTFGDTYDNSTPRLLLQDNSGTLRTIADSAYHELGSTTVGKTYHVAMTHVAGNHVHYVDGVAIASFSDILSRTDNDLYIGSGYSQSMRGVIHNVSVYNRPLTPAEILADYLEPFARWKQPALIIPAAAEEATETIYIPSLYVPDQKPLLGALPDLSHPASDGLVLDLVANEGGGSTVQDSSGHGNGGTLTANTTWASGIHGPAISTEGVSTGIETDFEFDGILEFTVSMVVYPFSNSSPRYLIDSSNGATGVGIRRTETTLLVFAYSTGGAGSLSVVGALPYTTWSHLTFVHTTTHNKMYIDGAEVGSLSYDASGGVTASSSPVVIAAEYDGTDRFYGLHSHVKIASRAWTPAEILADYLEPFARWKQPALIIPAAAEEATETIYIPSLYVPDQKPLLGALPDLSHPASQNLVLDIVANEGGGSTVQDSSGQGNNGTITGATWTAGIHGPALYYTNDDYVDLGSDDLIGQGELTVSVWALTRGNTENDYILFNGQFIFYGDDGIIRISRNAAATRLDGPAYNANEWYQFVLTSDSSGTNSKLYYNGAEVASGSVGTPGAASTNLYLGNNNTLTRDWNGNISSVKISNRAWTPAEVLADYLDPFARWKQPAIIIPSPGGAADHSFAVNDGIGVADAFGKGVAKGFSDSLGITDAVVKSIVQVVAESVGLTDAIQRGVGKNISDPVGVTDDMQRALAIVRTIADALGITDEMSTSEIADHVVVIADTLGLTDATIKGLSKLVSDDVAVSDAMSRIMVQLLTIDDALGITDSTSVLTGLLKAAVAFIQLKKHH